MAVVELSQRQIIHLSHRLVLLSKFIVSLCPSVTCMHMHNVCVRHSLLTFSQLGFIANFIPGRDRKSLYVYTL